MDNLKIILETVNSNEDINNKLIEIQRKYPQIRSINILENKNISHSSNKNNIGIFIDNKNFYPILY